MVNASFSYDIEDALKGNGGEMDFAFLLDQVKAAGLKPPYTILVNQPLTPEKAEQAEQYGFKVLVNPFQKPSEV